MDYTFARKVTLKYAKHFLLLPYVWAGDDPMAGFDCSGFIVELLKAAGILEPSQDLSADGLFNYFKSHEQSQAPGSLVFWPDAAGRIIHVEMIYLPGHTIGASGGGSGTLSMAEAIRTNAFIKMRPISYRGANYLLRDPFSPPKDSDVII
jgi:cell wall-associated NlpC family hydrolase